MTAGMPDYQKIIRPRYGAARTSFGTPDVDAGTETLLMSVDGRGMIYGGILFIWGDLLQNSGFPILKIDENEISDMSFYGMNLINLVKPQSYPFYLLNYDQKNGIYSVAVSNGITFETKLELSYDEQEDETPTVFFQLSYALI